MTLITESRIDLFTDNIPSLEDIKHLSEFIYSGESNMLAFTNQLQEHLSKTSAKACLANGIGLYLTGKNREAVEKLSKSDDCKEKFIFMAYSLRRLGRYEEAIENLQKSLKHGADASFVSFEKIETYRQAENYAEAEKELNKLANLAANSANYHYQKGRLQEVQGLYEQTIESYKKALELEPTHQQAIFHLAYRCDLSGDEDTAIEYYKQIASASPVYVSALINLAVLYEDSNQCEKAAQCIDKILEFHPNHPRAILFSKDIEGSKTMYYDEEKEKKKTHKNQILETPISDFELSVRSRNCLKKMKIDTIGDLIRTGEAELLSYKNFGETSLREIKAILISKGLRLGMNPDDNQSFIEETPGTVTNGDEALLAKPVDDLNLSVRSSKCLQKLNIRTIGELVKRTEAELLGCKNFGVTSLNEIKKALIGLGLSLRTLD